MPLFLNSYSYLEFSPSPLNESSTVLLPLFPQGAAGPLVAGPVSECGHLHLLHVGRLLYGISFTGKEILSESIEDVRTENFVLVDFSIFWVRPPHDWNIHVNYLELVRPADL